MQVGGRLAQPQFAYRDVIRSRAGGQSLQACAYVVECIYSFNLLSIFDLINISLKCA